MLKHALLAVAIGWGLPAKAISPDSDLYYSVDSSFRRDERHLEAKLTTGLDFSNPYLNLYAVTGGAYWIFSPFVAVGLEVAGFHSTKRQSLSALEETLGPYGLAVQPLDPKWSAAGVLRVTALSGLVNLFSATVVAAELGALVRAGTIRYGGQALAPTVGTGLELALRFKGDVGVLAALLWDADHPPSRPWESRVGFRVGPTFRF